MRRIGALTAELRPAPEREALTEYGARVGMLFQLRDDVLDVVGTEQELGKPAGQDLAEGVYTLPVLLALGGPDTGPELRSLLGQPLGQPERDKARAMVAASPAIGATVAAGRRFAVEAREATATLGDTAFTGALDQLAESLLDGLVTPEG